MKGSLGSPIFLKNRKKVLGILKKKTQIKNKLRNGKGIEYYSNGNIKYDGEFVNDKFEGKGKYIWEDGNYYIGQFKNGLSHGKGIEYYSNGNIMYDGEWINHEFVKK